MVALLGWQIIFLQPVVSLAHLVCWEALSLVVIIKIVQFPYSAAVRFAGILAAASGTNSTFCLLFGMGAEHNRPRPSAQIGAMLVLVVL